jgi:DNA-binding response OmpR family regulator/HPt (histidine-containing phosphotransfer) domain-containing protein
MLQIPKTMMKKILIIEDDPIIAHVYRTRLAKDGYEVHVAQDGHTGFYRIHDLRPDAVLLDLMLPKMNGIDILKRIRGERQFAQLPVLVFTNAYVPNMVNESYQAGATQVFNKASLTPQQIIEAIHTSIALAEITPVGESAATPGQPLASQLAPEATETPGFVPPASEDKEFQAQLVQSFLEKSQETVSLLRKSMHEFSKATDQPSRLEYLLELYRKVHAITSSAGLGGLHNIAQIAAAVEVLLKELRDKPKNINASTFRTVAHSIDFIASLLNRGAEGEVVDVASIDVMVVDDEILSRRAIAYALQKATMKPIIVEDAQMALTLANQRMFDCIFLDVRMPGMDGFELCSKIRTLTLNRATPVIFVTSLTDLKSRARSSLSGGSDFIAKPFMSIELSVKALTYVMQPSVSSISTRRAGGVNFPRKTTELAKGARC